MAFATRHALIVAAVAAVIGELTSGILKKAAFTIAAVLVVYLAWMAWTE